MSSHIRFLALLLTVCLSTASAAEFEEPFSIVVTGDAIVGRPLMDATQPGFLEVVNILRAADAAVINLELVLRDGEGHAQRESGGGWLEAPGERVEDLRWMGVDMAAHANNHSFDFGAGALLATHAYLERAGIAIAGSGADLNAARSPAFFGAGGKRVALVSTASTFVNFGIASAPVPGHPGRPGLNPLRVTRRLSITADTADQLSNIAERDRLSYYRDERGHVDFAGTPFIIGDAHQPAYSVNTADLEANLEQIAAAARAADYVAVSIHAHQVKVEPGPPEFLVEFARAAIDAGADVFFGHGPHFLHGIEIYRGRPIFYSLGNFIFQSGMKYQPWDFHDQWGTDPGEPHPSTSAGQRFRENESYWVSVLPVIRFAGNELSAVELIPLWLQPQAARGDAGRPIRAPGQLGDEIVELLNQLSGPMGTRIVSDGDGGYQVDLSGQP